MGDRNEDELLEQHNEHFVSDVLRQVGTGENIIRRSFTSRCGHVRCIRHLSDACLRTCIVFRRTHCPHSRRLQRPFVHLQSPCDPFSVPLCLGLRPQRRAVAFPGVSRQVRRVLVGQSPGPLVSTWPMTLSSHTRCAAEFITHPSQREIHAMKGVTTDHGFVVETLAIPRSHRSSRGCEICEDNECLPAHLGRLKRDNVEDCAIREKKSIELRTEFLFVDRVI